MAACLHKLKNLKELRVLIFRMVDKRVTANLKELCEALQKEGGSQLTRVQQLGNPVLTRHPDDLSWKSGFIS
jgi:hypothetical protein